MICISIGVCLVLIILIGVIGSILYSITDRNGIILGVTSLAQLLILGYWGAGLVMDCEKTKYLYKD